MKQPSIHIPVQISAAEFRAFALFDTFRRKRQWRRPAVFLLIMGVSAALCYSRYPQEGALLLGTILLVLGLALPLTWYLLYEHSLHVQAKKMGLLQGPRRAYTLVFQDDGIQISADQGKTFAPLGWDAVTGVYRRAADQGFGEDELVPEAFRDAFKHPPRGGDYLGSDAVPGKEKYVSFHVSPPPSARRISGWSSHARPWAGEDRICPWSDLSKCHFRWLKCRFRLSHQPFVHFR